MTLLTFSDLPISVDQVLCAQGMDPAAVRARRPRLLDLTERGLAAGLPFLQPRAVVTELAVRGVRHERILLADGHFLQGELVSRLLASAETISVAVCTVGETISDQVRALFDGDPALAMAVEGVASAAVEVLGNQVCQQISVQAEAHGLQTSIPLNPGLVGWPVEQGQPQVFACLDAAAIGVTLEPSGLMRPLKSLSLVVGAGRELDRQGSTCDYCHLQSTCAHRGVRA